MESLKSVKELILKERLVNMKHRLLLLPFSLLLILSGCSKEIAANGLNENEPSSLVTLSNTSISIPEERTFLLEATIDSSLDKYLKFWSSDNEEVATVSDSGLVTAIKKGSTVVTLQVGKYFARCAVEVTDYLPYATLSIYLQKDTYNLNVNDQFQLNPVVKLGNEVIENYIVASDSSNSNIASFGNESLTIHALNKGRCDILLTFTYLSYSVEELIYVNVY